MPRPGRPRISTGIHESKTLALYNAGRALLAARDHEAFSVAQIAKQGRCSVGAFYVRFPDKTAFLSFVIGHSFDFAARSFADTLAHGGISVTGVPAKAQLAVSRLAEQFADPEFAGALRAAVKLGFAEPHCRVPFDLYKTAIADHVTDWLADGRTRHEAQIEAALHIILGALTDAALSEDGAVSLKSNALQNALGFLLQNAASGAFKSGRSFGRPKPSKTAHQKTLPVSALKKPPESARERPSKMPAPKPAQQKSLPASPARRIRKV
ncbi:TetR/AcrR family transcriptional regulator [Hyphomonas sp.]|uniref:TetR/AcrR family transcriptional regulator n=1 Tax=Hyphomonas sp. TaxID=87 RepID=UPI00391ADCF5